MFATKEGPPVATRRTDYQQLFELHTAVLRETLRCYQANRITGEQFATTLIVFGSRFAVAPNTDDQVTLCQQFLEVLCHGNFDPSSPDHASAVPGGHLPGMGREYAEIRQTLPLGRSAGAGHPDRRDV